MNATKIRELNLDDIKNVAGGATLSVSTSVLSASTTQASASSLISQPATVPSKQTVLKQMFSLFA